MIWCKSNVNLELSKEREKGVGFCFVRVHNHNSFSSLRMRCAKDDRDKRINKCVRNQRGTSEGPAAPRNGSHTPSERPPRRRPPTTLTHPAGIPLTGCIIFILVRAGDDVNALSGSQQLAYTCNSVIAPPEGLKSSLGEEREGGRQGGGGVHTSGVVSRPGGWLEAEYQLVTDS